jgi:phosphopantetheine adenylyltransferase
LRKQKYKDEDWDYRKNAGRGARFLHWATTVDPTGGQRHGPGALGKQLIKEHLLAYQEAQEYEDDRKQTDEAMDHLSNQDYTKTYQTAKGLNAKKWEDKAKELLKHQGTWGIESEQKQELGDKYQQLATDIKMVQGALVAGDQPGGDRYPLQVNIHTILPGVPDGATRGGHEAAFITKMRGNFSADDSIATPDWFVGQHGEDTGGFSDSDLNSHELLDFPINGQISHTYYSIFSPEETPARITVEPKAVDLIFPNGAGSFTYEPKYKKVESEDGVSDVWIGYEQKEGGERPTFTTSSTLSNALEGTPYRQTITTSDPNEGSRRTISAQGTPPGWLEVRDNGDGTAVLSGTPTQSDAGEAHQVTLRVQDEIGLQYERTFTINVQANQAPLFTGETTRVTAVSGHPFIQTVNASDPDVPLGDQMSISAAQPPNWLQISDMGNGTALLFGRPGAADEGEHTMILQVSDRAGATAARPLVIDVQPAPETNADGEQVQTKRAEAGGAPLLIQRQAAEGEEEEGLFADEEDFFAEEEAAPAETAVPAEPAVDELESEAILSGESQAEVDEETTDFPTLAAIGRRAQLIESLPEPPEGMIEAVQGPALAYAHVEVEEYDLRLQKQQIGAMQEHAKGQDVELKGAQTAAAINKQGVEAQQRDADTKMKTQDDMKGALADKEGQAKQTDEQGQKGESFFSKILGGIIQGFGMGAILGVGDNADANAAGEGTQQTSQVTSDTSKSTKSGQKEVDKYQARTMKVRAEADKSHAELEETEDHLGEKRDENKEGMGELQEAGGLNAMQLENVQSEKERLQDEHLNAIDEAESWADEHRSVREEIFLLLEEDMGAPAEEQDDRLEEMAP